MPKWRRKRLAKRRKNQGFVVLTNETGYSWIEKRDLRDEYCPVGLVAERGIYREHSQAMKALQSLPPIIIGRPGSGQTSLNKWVLFLEIFFGWLGGLFTTPWKVAYYRELLQQQEVFDGQARTPAYE